MVWVVFGALAGGVQKCSSKDEKAKVVLLVARFAYFLRWFEQMEDTFLLVCLRLLSFCVVKGKKNERRRVGVLYFFDFLGCTSYFLPLGVPPTQPLNTTKRLRRKKKNWLDSKSRPSPDSTNLSGRVSHSNSDILSLGFFNFSAPRTVQIVYL